MMSENKANSLYLKMARIMGEIGRISKDATTDAGRYSYKYASDDAVYTAVQKHLSENGIALFAAMVDVQQDLLTIGEGNNVKQVWHTRAKFEFTLADSETGETFTCPWFAEARGNDDKGVNKCATAALKYWLLKTFIIPTGNDPDGDPVVEEAKKRGGVVTKTSNAKFPQGFHETLTAKVSEALNIDGATALAGIEKHIASGGITPKMTPDEALTYIQEQAAAKKAATPPEKAAA